MTTIAFTILCSGLWIFALCLPLIFRKMPMNGYGLRIPEAFESEERWYDINAYAGRRMAAWSLLIIAAGAVGFWVPPRHVAIYGFSSAVVSLIAVLVPAIQAIKWSRKTDDA